MRIPREDARRSLPPDLIESRVPSMTLGSYRVPSDFRETLPVSETSDAIDESSLLIVLLIHVFDERDPCD